MTSQVDQLVARYRATGVLLDSNILVLLFVGADQPNLIGRFKRTRQFVASDFKALTELINRFSRVVTTPHVMTEAVNMIGQLAEPARSRVLESITQVAEGLAERYTPMTELMLGSQFIRFGLTDAAIAVAGVDCLLVTDDNRLAATLTAIGIDTINFNHIRTEWW